MPTPVSEDTKSKISKDIFSGEPIADIAKRRGVSDSYVSKLKKKLQGDIPPRDVVGASLDRHLDRAAHATAPARKRGKRKQPAPVAAPVDALLGVLDESALPHLLAESDRLRGIMGDAQTRLGRVQALIRLHEMRPSALPESQPELALSEPVEVADEGDESQHF